MADLIRDKLAGTVIEERFRIEALIGSGASGSVYSGTHLLLGKPVAIKVLHAHADSDRWFRRFRHECQALSKLNHPSIPKVYACGFSSDKVPYVVMELIRGRTLEEELAQHPNDRVSLALRIGVQVASALQAAHDKGVLHRDIKPSNIMLLEGASCDAEGKRRGEAVLPASGSPPGQADRVAVTDFGLALLANAAKVTRTGSIVGTPQYMSPEQSQGKKATGASDIYSLGCVLHRILAGRPPFEGDTVFVLLEKHASAPVPPLPADVPEFLKAAVLRCMSKDPSHRFASPGELKEVLEREVVVDEQVVSSNAKPRRWLGVGVGIGILTVVLPATWFFPESAQIFSWHPVPAESALPDDVQTIFEQADALFRQAMVCHYLGNCHKEKQLLLCASSLYRKARTNRSSVTHLQIGSSRLREAICLKQQWEHEPESERLLREAETQAQTALHKFTNGIEKKENALNGVGCRMERERTRHLVLKLGKLSGDKQSFRKAVEMTERASAEWKTYAPKPGIDSRPPTWTIVSGALSQCDRDKDLVQMDKSTEMLLEAIEVAEQREEPAYVTIACQRAVQMFEQAKNLQAAGDFIRKASDYLDRLPEEPLEVLKNRSIFWRVERLADYCHRHGDDERARIFARTALKIIPPEPRSAVQAHEVADRCRTILAQIEASSEVRPGSPNRRKR